MYCRLDERNVDGVNPKAHHVWLIENYAKRLSLTLSSFMVVIIVFITFYL